MLGIFVYALLVVGGFSTCWFMWKEIKRTPWGMCSMLLPGVAGFAVFPAINLIAIFVGLWAIEKDKEGRK